MSPESLKRLLLVALVGVVTSLMAVWPSVGTPGQDQALLLLVLLTLGMLGVALVMAMRFLQPRAVDHEPLPNPISDEMVSALFLAREEAEQDGHAAITDLHILRGLLRTRGTVAELILARAGITVERLPAPTIQPPAIDDATPGQVPLSVTARVCLMAARDEARLLGHDQLRTGHVLLALLRGEVSTVAVILHGAGLDRLAVMTVMAQAA